MTQRTRSITPFAVTVCGVHHDGIDAGLDQGLDTLFGALAHAHRRAHAQAAPRSRAALGKLVCFGDVLHRDQAFELEGVVDDQDALELVLVEQRLGFGRRGAFLFSLTVMSFSRGVMIWCTLTS